MKPKTMILAVVAVVCGLGAMWMTNRLLAEKQVGGTEKEVREKVLVAKGKIPAQTVFKEVDKYFEEKEIPTAFIPPKALRTADKILGKRLSRNLAEGDYITEELLVNPQTDGLGAVLPPGMRAVTIRVQPDSNVSGFVLPKSHVDVLCTVRNSEGSATYAILENMEVLAIDNKLTREAEGTSIAGTTVTLAASPEDCNLIKMAASTGPLDLVLRGIGDEKSTRPRMANQKVLENARPRDNSESQETASVTPGNTSPLPNLPPVAQGPAATPPAAETPKKEEPETEVFVMTIITGPNVDKVRYTKKKGESWPAEANGTSSTPAATEPPAKNPETGPNQPGNGPVQRNRIGS